MYYVLIILVVITKREGDIMVVKLCDLGLAKAVDPTGTETMGVRSLCFIPLVGDYGKEGVCLVFIANK
jgi:hypothetical protein